MRGCQPLTPDQVAVVLPALRGRMALRDRALFLLGVTTGLRISELLSLDFQDVVMETRQLRQEFAVRRRAVKGRTAGKVCRLQPVAAEAVARWAVVARALHGAQPTWPLFFSCRKRRLTRFRAYRLLRDAFRRAGLGLACPGTHTMRKTFAGAVFRRLCERRAAGEAIEPLLALREETGHVRLDTLRAYLESMSLPGQQATASFAEELRGVIHRQGGQALPPPNIVRDDQKRP